MAKALSPMAHPLYLTTDERTLFDALPAKLKEGWEVKEEKGTYQDDDMKRMLRMTFVRLQDPALKQLQVKLKSVKNEQELVELGKTVDFSSASEEDLAELFFAMGAENMTLVIRMQLAEVRSDSDLDAVSMLSNVRHVFYNSVPA